MTISLEIEDPLQAVGLTDEMYAAAAYEAMDKFYKEPSKIKENATLSGNTLEVRGFKSVSMLTGKEPYSLKTALLTSQRTKNTPNGKMLTVPIEGKVVTMTESSTGWNHPGFETQYFKDYMEFITSIKIIEMMK